MPENRCPMCSKPNPEENEVCQFCQARLKPLVVGQPSEDDEQAGQPPEDNEQAGQPHPPPPTSSPTEDLSRLRSEYEEILPDLFPPEEEESDTIQEASKEPTYEEPETSDEYLRRLGAAEGTAAAESSQTQEAVEPGSEPDEPVPEWLARIRDKEGTSSEASDQPDEDNDDWLTRLRQKDGVVGADDEDRAAAVESTQDQPGSERPGVSPPLEDPTFEPTPDSPLGDEIESTPEWFSESVSSSDEDAPDEPAEPGEMPGWLAEARQESPKAEEPVSPEPAPDWMAEAGAPATPAGDEHDDLEGSVGPFASSPPEDEPSTGVDPDESPSWLADELEGGAGNEEDEGGLSWLESEVDVNLQDLDSGAFMAIEEEDEVELPGWLADAVDPSKAAGAQDAGFDSARMEPKPAQHDTGSEAEGLTEEGDTPGETPLGPASKPFPDGTVEPERQPDISWDELKGESRPSSELDVPSRPFVEQPEPEEEHPAEKGDGLGLPAWLDEIQEPSPEPEQPAEETPALTIEPGTPSQPKREESGLNLDALELPEWIGDMRDDAAGGAEGSPELAPATLPTWLEAMRPIESFKSDKALVPEEDQSIESIGPLAGLRGVLAAEPIMAMPRTGTIGGARLEVSEQQYARAELLSHMVEEEKNEQAELKPERRRIPVARLLVTLALLAALFFSLPGSEGAAGNRFLAPENQPRSLNNLYDMVHNAPLDRPVLVVFDYSPAYAGELETYAAPILADIVNRELKIITVSTHPTGPPLAARMLQNVSGARELQNTRDYLHFGYLSGGPTAVQLFAANPRQALLYGFQLPVGTQTTGIWSYPIVQNISQLSDFGLLVVITAGTDSARTWVEQAGPYLGETPLALVLSAGVEPLLQPYAVGVEPQVDSILSGLPVAHVYEGYMGFEGTARTNWDAFGSMLTVVELILIGGAIYGLAHYILRAMGVVKE